MFTPFDTAHMTHRADRHLPASAATREVNRRIAAKRRGAWRGFTQMLTGFLARGRTGAVPLRTRA